MKFPLRHFRVSLVDFLVPLLPSLSHQKACEYMCVLCLIPGNKGDVLKTSLFQLLNDSSEKSQLVVKKVFNFGRRRTARQR